MLVDFLRLTIITRLTNAIATAAIIPTTIMVKVFPDTLPVIILLFRVTVSSNGCPLKSIVSFFCGYPSLIIWKLYDPAVKFLNVA